MLCILGGSPPESLLNAHKRDILELAAHCALSLQYVDPRPWLWMSLIGEVEGREGPSSKYLFTTKDVIYSGLGDHLSQFWKMNFGTFPATHNLEIGSSSVCEDGRISLAGLVFWLGWLVVKCIISGCSGEHVNILQQGKAVPWIQGRGWKGVKVQKENVGMVGQGVLSV